MSFNPQEYENLNSEEIEKLIKELNEKTKGLQKIVYERDNNIDKAINKHDLEGLKNALEKNGNKPLREETGVGIQFVSLKAENIDFFLYVVALPEFIKKFNKANYHSELTKEEEGVSFSIREKKLFDFFINHPKYSQYFERIIPLLSNHGIDKKADKDVIPELFNRGFIKPTEKTFTKALDSQAYNFLEYFIENNIYEDIKNKLSDIYLKVWNQPHESVTKLVKEKFPQFKKITLNTLVNTFAVNRQSKEPDVEKYETLVSHNIDSYLKVMEDHPMTKADIHNILIAFSRIEDEPDYPRLHSFCNFIIEKKPEHITDIKNFYDSHSLKNKNFITELERAMLHIELITNLEPQNEQFEPKKLKI